MRLLGWRNRILGSARFQRHAAANPFLRPIARRRAGALFDLVAGFTYSQVLLCTVESGCVQRLGEGPASADELARLAGLSPDATLRLLRAAAAIGIVENARGDWWMLGRHGAALHENAGALAMIRHHTLLYADLADPLALLRADRAQPTALSHFWSYAGAAAEADPQRAGAYSQLMSASQAPVAQEVLAAYDLSRHTSLLDVGGGQGTFLGAVGAAHPALRLGLFDLPEVTARLDAGRVAVHPGSFFEDALPRGYDCISLVRILHDHDDGPALEILRNIRAALEPGGALLIAEPMAGTPGAEAMGGAYFGFYLWAMGQGRPRTAKEIHSMLRDAGFARSRWIATRQPLITSLIVATA
ncbi:methyltransferase [Citromicrobium bathyomarinum]